MRDRIVLDALEGAAVGVVLWSWYGILIGACLYVWLGWPYSDRVNHG